MSNCASISSSLYHNDVCFLELATAIDIITNKYRATGALLSKMVYLRDTTNIHKLSCRNFIIPPSKYLIPYKINENIINVLENEINTFIDLYIDEYIEGDFSARHVAKIITNVQSGSEKAWIHHIFSTQKAKDGKILIDCLSIYEEYSSNCRYGSLKNKGKLDHDDRVFLEYDKFIYGEDSDDIDEFLLFRSHFDKKINSLPFVNSKIIDGCWKRMLATGQHHTGLPWEERYNNVRLENGNLSYNGSGSLTSDHAVDTVTLSLDLRKSTAMMEQAENPVQYALWLEALTEIGLFFTLQNDGVFDKFTGDGIISHFVDISHLEGNSEIERPEFDNVYQARDQPSGDSEFDRNITTSLLRSLTCAHELLIAVKLHIDAIASKMRFRIGKAGPAIGIAFDRAAWALDAGGRPVVVGKGVVNACRLTGGESGTIRIAYNMKHRLEAQLPDTRFEVHQLRDHKDIPPEQWPLCWQIRRPQVPGSRSITEIRVEVERITREIKDRHERERLR